MKIPKEAKLMYRGVIFDVYQWQQKMFDGSLATFEMLKRPHTVEVVATQGNKILLTHQSQPNKSDFYSLIGGRGDKDGKEEPLETAKRELLEESGLESSDWELVKMYEPYHKIDWQIYLYVARNCQKVASQKLDAGEKINIVERTFAEFLKEVESEKYWGNELTLDILRLKQSKKGLKEFKQKLFPTVKE